MFQSSSKIMNKSRSPFRSPNQEKTLGHYVTDFFSAGKIGKMNPDQVVHYKIFLCAAGYEPEIRRITIDKDICHNYFYLKQKILAIFPTLKDVAFTISWKDREGDNIRICTDDELVIALKEMQSFDFKKIYVNATPQGKEGPLHPDVMCDGCEHPVQGFRYKCIVCYDYDLCPDCERSQVHPDHPMIRIPLPLSAEMPFGRRFARDISRMSKHLERLFQQSTEQCGYKKAKGDFSSGSRSTPCDKKGKMKFCHHNEIHNFLHGIVLSQLEKLHSASGGDSNSTSNNQTKQETHPTEAQASSSTDGYPILEEQKNFVNILTNGLNSFLDPLGIDVIVEEDPVKEENSQKHPESHQSGNGSAEGNSSVPTAQEAATADAPAFHRAPSSSTSGTSAGPSVKPKNETASFTVPNNFTTPSAAPTVRVSAPMSNNAIPASLITVPTTVGVNPSLSAVGVQRLGTFPVPAPTGVPAPVQIGVPTGVPAPVRIGVPAPVSAGVPVPVSAGVPALVPSAVPLPAPTGVPAPAQFGVSLPGSNIFGTTLVELLTSRPKKNHSEHQESALPPSRDDISILDNSWTIVNDGMGESMIVSPSPSPNPAAAGQEAAQESEGINPKLGTNLSTEEALVIMQEMGYKDEDWLVPLIVSKKGNIEEIMRFLSPIPKPKPSTNLND